MKRKLFEDIDQNKKYQAQTLETNRTKFTEKKDRMKKSVFDAYEKDYLDKKKHSAQI